MFMYDFFRAYFSLAFISLEKNDTILDPSDPFIPPFLDEAIC
jgi:hypothetical protein